jgi:hypothetical protein
VRVDCAKEGTADGVVAFGISNSAMSLIRRMIRTHQRSHRKWLLDTLIAYWKMVVSMGDYALNPPTHLSRDWEDANSIGRAKSMGEKRSAEAH